jgi:dihydroxy-acid dehydratase
LQADGGIAIVRGNLAPNGAVIKTSAATPNLLKHTGPAAVLPDSPGFGVDFHSEDIDRNFAHITADHVIVGRNKGPVGAPGMPEGGNIELPKHILQQGVRDMVRVVDNRMSGTCFGTIVLHVSPEAAIGGPLAIVKDGDMIELDARAGKLNLLVEEREINRRLSEWKAPQPKFETGYRSLWMDQVNQAQDGCDFKFNVDKNWRKHADPKK